MSYEEILNSFVMEDVPEEDEEDSDAPDTGETPGDGETTSDIEESEEM
ncbi:MAG: hypothetical protein Q7R84_00080 [bacterium]|nr:hypothetical protein [bacterium]